MCSILALLDIGGDPQDARAVALRLSRRMRHRGPDWSGIHADDRCVLAHERLAIVGIDDGAQPLRSADGRKVLAVNGEIYNHRELRSSLDYQFQTGSDCEVVLALWEPGKVEFLNDLNGIFAFVAVDVETGAWIIARDPIGVMPLYYGRDEHGTLYVSSEMKALHDVCSSFQVFPPGHVWESPEDEPREYYKPTWREYASVTGQEVDPAGLRSSLEAAVHRQLMSDVPYGVLLSGGLDSSLISACAARFAKQRVESDDRETAWWPQLHSFAIGLRGSPDLAAARTAAEALGTVHHGFEFTLQEGLDAMGDVIWHLETYDVTTIRASTPMYLMGRRIKAMGIKMVLSGEGADEIFGGYLYFHKAPNPEAFHQETVRKLDRLHLYDCLRANKSLAAWGVEVRVPFLDRAFLDVAMSFDSASKMCGHDRIEKHVLRAAFDGALPDEILWRQKEQFSDGVGYAWIDGLKAHADELVSDEQLVQASWRFPHNMPASKEAYLYRVLFESHFPGSQAADTVPGGPSVACSTPTAIQWDASFSQLADPSGRAVRGVHRESY